MRYVPRQPRSRRRGPGLVSGLPAAAGAALLCLVAGCHRAPAPQQATESMQTPEVTVTAPERKTVRRLIEQPGYNIEAFQQTPLYAKVAGYVRKVNADIGDAVKGP